MIDFTQPPARGMYRYLISIGSNLDPARNVPVALEQVLAQAGRCVLSRAIETEPVGMTSQYNFLNLMAYLETSLDPVALKDAFNAIETELGRDRSDPQRKVKDRPVDLDILTPVTSLQDCLTAVADCPAYGRAILFELLDVLLWDRDARVHHTQPFTLGDRTVGAAPVALDGALA